MTVQRTPDDNGARFGKTWWRTPQRLFDALDARFRFVLDACAAPENALCDRFWTADDNALVQDWRAPGGYIWCNWPFSRAMNPAFARTIAAEAGRGARIVALGPVAMSAGYFRTLRAAANEIWGFDRRLCYGDPVTGELQHGASFDSAIFVFHGQRPPARGPFMGTLTVDGRPTTDAGRRVWTYGPPALPSPTTQRQEPTMTTDRYVLTARAIARALPGSGWAVNAAGDPLGMAWTGADVTVTTDAGGYRRGLAFDRAGRWVVDDGRGCVEAGHRVGGLVTTLQAAWPAVRALLADPAEALADAVRGRRSEDDPPVAVRHGVVQWGEVSACIMPDALTGERWPYVEARGVTYRLRQVVPVGPLAHAMAAAMARLVRGGWWGITVYGIQPADLPDTVHSIAVGRATACEDWIDRLKATLREETACQRQRREATAAERASVQLVEPASEDDTGAGLVDVPALRVGALWALGFGVRAISKLTTGNDRAKSSINRRLRELRRGGASVEAREFIERAGLGWALEPVQATLDDAPPCRPVDPPAEPARDAPAEPCIRVRRRQPAPTPIEAPAARDTPDESKRPDPTARGVDLAPLQMEAQPRKVRDFLDMLPDSVRGFCAVLARTDGWVPLSTIMDALDLSLPKAVGGLHGSLSRWAPVRGLRVPHGTRMIDGERAWCWLGFGEGDPTSRPAPADQVVARDAESQIERVCAALPEGRRPLARRFLALLFSRQTVDVETAAEVLDIPARRVNRIAGKIESETSAAGFAAPFRRDGQVFYTGRAAA